CRRTPERKGVTLCRSLFSPLMHFPCSGLHRIPVGEKLFCQVRRQLIGRGDECKERRCNVVHLASGKRWNRCAATRLFKAQETSAGGPSCVCGSLNFLHWS